jgi:hypothetical protein
MKAWAALGVTVLALGTGLWMLLVHDGALQEDRLETAARTSVRQAPATVHAPTGAASGRANARAGTERGAASSRTAPAAALRRGAASPARDAYERAAMLGAVFNALRAQGDPDALFFAERALHDCAQLLLAGDQAGSAVPIDRYRPLAGGDPVAARRKAAYDRLSTRCAGFDLGADPAATARALRDAWLASGDPRAALAQAALAVRRGADPAAAMQQARELTSAGDPYMLDETAALVGAMRGRYVFMFDGQLVRPDVVAAAWSLAACDAGRECGAASVEAPCAFLAECDATDLETSLARYQLAPGDFDRMQLVRARIVQGFAANRWDPALFAPQPQPPWYRRGGP